MSIADPKTPEEKEKHDALVEAAKRGQDKQRKQEKRGRQQAEDNSDEAIKKRTDFDPFTGR